MTGIACMVQSSAVADDTMPPEETGRAVYTKDDLLKNYDPRPALVTKVTPTPKPKFPAIDIHCHWFMQQEAEKVLKSMDDLGLEKAVNLSGGFGPELEHLLKRFHSVAPDRLFIFANIDFSHVDDATFPQDTAAAIEHAHALGASGLTIFKSLGLTIRDASKKIVPVDDPRLDPVFEKCADLHFPVLIHSADPPAFFQPTDRFNERWMQLKRHPDWSFYGGDFPKYEEVLAQHIRMIAKHPRTAFISAHLANSGDDLKTLSTWLDKCPNLYVDISGRVEELGRQPYSARKFLLKYQDRVLFGTDRYPGRPDQPRNAIYYRFLETDDENFDYYDNPFPPEGDWRIYGVFLPDEALKKIYHDNATRALAGKLPLTPEPAK